MNNNIIGDKSPPSYWSTPGYSDGIARDLYGKEYEKIKLETPEGPVITQNIPPQIKHNPYIIPTPMIPVGFPPAHEQPNLTDAPLTSLLTKRRPSQQDRKNPPRKVSNQENLCRTVLAKMNKLFSEGDINRFRVIFQKALDKGRVNAEIFETYMRLENKLEDGDINLAREAFNKAKKLVPLTGRLINIYMENEKKQGNIERVEEVFQLCIEKNLLDKEILKTYIFCQSHLPNGSIENVRKAFQLTWSDGAGKGLLSTGLFNTYILAEEKMNSLDSLEKVNNYWQQGLKIRGLCNSTLFSTYIFFAKNKKNIEAIRSAFNQAVELKQYSNNLFLVAIESERELGDNRNATVLRDIFEKAIASDCRLEATFFCNYMSVQSEIQKGSIRSVRRAFHTAVKRNLFDTKIIATLLHCESNMSSHLDSIAMEEIRKAFNLALKHKLDLHTSNLALVYIEIENRYGSIECLDRIRDAFNAANSNNCYSVNLFSRYISIMLKNRESKEAIKAFHLAMQIPEMEFTDTFFLQYIRGIEGFEVSIKEIRRAYEWALEKNCATSNLFHTYMIAENIATKKGTEKSSVSRDDIIYILQNLEKSLDRQIVGTNSKSLRTCIDLLKIYLRSQQRINKKDLDIETIRSIINHLKQQNLCYPELFITYILAEEIIEGGEIKYIRDIISYAKDNNQWSVALLSKYMGAEYLGAIKRSADYIYRTYQFAKDSKSYDNAFFCNYLKAAKDLQQKANVTEVREVLRFAMYETNYCSTGLLMLYIGFEIDNKTRINDGLREVRKVYDFALKHDLYDIKFFTSCLVAETKLRQGSIDFDRMQKVLRDAASKYRDISRLENFFNDAERQERDQIWEQKKPDHYAR